MLIIYMQLAFILFEALHYTEFLEYFSNFYTRKDYNFFLIVSFLKIFIYIINLNFCSLFFFLLLFVVENKNC